MDKKLAKRIGQRVKTARTDIGLSQDKFARMAKVTRGYLSDIERGEKSISVETLVKLCKASGVNATRMLA